jgi:hypothetical protein
VAAAAAPAAAAAAATAAAAPDGAVTPAAADGADDEAVDAAAAAGDADDALAAAAAAVDALAAALAEPPEEEPGPEAQPRQALAATLAPAPPRPQLPPPRRRFDPSAYARFGGSEEAFAAVQAAAVAAGDADGQLDKATAAAAQQAAAHQQGAQRAADAAPPGAEMAAAAVGELAVRLSRERARRRAAAERHGVRRVLRMAGPRGAADPSTGVHTDLRGVECCACGGDLSLSGVVAPWAPARAACPDHADALLAAAAGSGGGGGGGGGGPSDGGGGSSSNKDNSGGNVDSGLVMLVQHAPGALERLLADAARLVPGAAQCAEAALRRERERGERRARRLSEFVRAEVARRRGELDAAAALLGALGGGGGDDDDDDDEAGGDPERVEAEVAALAAVDDGAHFDGADDAAAAYAPDPVPLGPLYEPERLPRALFARLVSAEDEARLLADMGFFASGGRPRGAVPASTSGGAAAAAAAAAAGGGGGRGGAAAAAKGEKKETKKERLAREAVEAGRDPNDPPPPKKRGRPPGSTGRGRGRPRKYPLAAPGGEDQEGGEGREGDDGGRASKGGGGRSRAGRRYSDSELDDDEIEALTGSRHGGAGAGAGGGGGRDPEEEAMWLEREQSLLASRGVRKRKSTIAAAAKMKFLLRRFA